MSLKLEAIAAAILFLVGLRLSAFYSGSETGFYRLSLPRLDIDARAGDKTARQLQWFSKNPAYFIATCLIGNNVANYVTTAAIGWMTLIVFAETNAKIEIVATLLMAPIIFQFGELLPKNVYYLTPLTRLSKETRWFRYSFRSFLLLSYPLVLITRVFERISAQQHQPTEMLLGRNRLVQLLQHSHEEGVLTDIQSRLTNGLLLLAPQPILNSMTPHSRILGLPDSVSRIEFLEFARKFGVSGIVVRKADQPQSWYGYISVAELLATTQPQLIVQKMPVIDFQSSKLVALHQLQREQATFGVIHRDGEVLGVVSRNGLVEQIFRPEIAQAHARGLKKGN